MVFDDSEAQILASIYNLLTQNVDCNLREDIYIVTMLTFCKAIDATYYYTLALTPCMHCAITNGVLSLIEHSISWPDLQT